MSNFVDVPLLSTEHRVCIYKDQGGRNHMEDVPVFLRNNYDGVPEGVIVEPYDYVAIFDGHGGNQASEYASQHLLHDIICQKAFWSDEDAQILGAIRQGFIDCHYRMWEASKSWPNSSPGIICTAGTTASVAFVRHGKVYVGHVGDSGIALGRTAECPADKRDCRFKGINSQNSSPVKSNGGGSALSSFLHVEAAPPRGESRFEALMLTKDHKPESAEERERIESLGGEVRSKSGVHRVVWKRPIAPAPSYSICLKLPVNPVPFLAVARSLGDFWSYEEERKEFVVSPVPDVAVHSFFLPKHHSLVAGSDGLWNVVRASECLDIVEECYRLQELWIWQCLRADKQNSIPLAEINVAELLVRKVLNRCEIKKMRSDNVGIVIYYPVPSQDKIRYLLDHPAETSAYPWFQDPDLGIAQYRSSLMTLQNMVSCIGPTRVNLSIMEVAYRIDTIGFAPRLKQNPLRDHNRHGNNLEDEEGSSFVFDVDMFLPQCALVITKDDESVQVPAYTRLFAENKLTHIMSGMGGINPLRRTTTDLLISQRIKFLKTHSSHAIKSTVSTNGNDTENSSVGFVNGTKRIRVAGWNGNGEVNGNTDTLPPGPFVTLFPKEDELTRMTDFPCYGKDQ